MIFVDPSGREIRFEKSGARGRGIRPPRVPKPPPQIVEPASPDARAYNAIMPKCSGGLGPMSRDFPSAVDFASAPDGPAIGVAFSGGDGFRRFERRHRLWRLVIDGKTLPGHYLLADGMFVLTEG